MNLTVRKFSFLNDTKHIIVYDANKKELVKIYIDKQIEFSQPVLHGGYTWKAVNMIAENFDIFWNLVPERSADNNGS